MASTQPEISEEDEAAERAAYVKRWQDQIATMLEEAGKKQAWLVRETGIDQTTVSKWMNGERGPNVHQLKKVARAFGLELEQLLGWTPGKGAPAVIAEGKVPGRVEAYLAGKPNWLSAHERETFISAVKAINASPDLDLTDKFLHQLGQAIKFGYAVSGQD